MYVTADPHVTIADLAGGRCGPAPGFITPPTHLVAVHRTTHLFAEACVSTGPDVGRMLGCSRNRLGVLTFGSQRCSQFNASRANSMRVEPIQCK